MSNQSDSRNGAVEIRRASIQDYGRITDFGNLVFNINFPALLPKLYSGRPETSPAHYLLTEDGEIKAMVGSFPMRFHVGGCALSVRGIGTVSVHPDSRGKGYMKLLMERAVDDARAEGAHLMCLGGQRQRYEYFGFGMAAAQAVFTVDPANLRHRREVSAAGMRLTPLTDDSPHLAACIRLHDSQPVHAERPAGCFADILRSWSCAPYVLLMDGAVAGYASILHKKDAANTVQELVLDSGTDCLKAVFSIVEFCEGAAAFHIPWTHGRLYEALSGAAEKFSLSGRGMIQALDLPRVLEAYLNLRGDLCDGRLVLGMEGTAGAEKYELRVEQGRASCVPGGGTPDIALPPALMTARLFSPDGFLRERGALERNWFPAALNIPDADMC